MEAYNVVSCNDEDIVAVLLPSSSRAYRIVDAQPETSLAYRVVRDPEIMEILGDDPHNVPGPSSSPGFVEPVIALRRSGDAYLMGSDRNADIKLQPAQGAGSFLQFQLTDEDPFVQLKILSKNVIINGRIPADTLMDVFKETSLLFCDVLFKLFPLKALANTLRLESSKFMESAGQIGNHEEVDLRTSHANQYQPIQKPASLEVFREQLKLLTRGAFGQIYVFKSRRPGPRLAVKVMDYLPDDDVEAAGKAKVIRTELIMFSKMKDNDYLIKIYQAFHFSQGAALIMPLLPLGSIHNVVRNYGGFSRDTVKTITAQILAGLESLHEQSIIHRDIKPENVLVRSLNPIHVMITDFGLAKLAETAGSWCGTKPFVAPEVNPITYSPYDCRVDVYSLALVMARLLGMLQLPRNSLTSPGLWDKYVAQPIASKLQQAPINSDWSKALKTVKTMASYKPGDRPFAKECFRLPWFAGRRKEDLMTRQKPFEMIKVPELGPTYAPRRIVALNVNDEHALSITKSCKRKRSVTPSRDHREKKTKLNSTRDEGTASTTESDKVDREEGVDAEDAYLPGLDFTANTAGIIPTVLDSKNFEDMLDGIR